ncbi:MAG: Asp23/Gls24 family envelope stress response protein [Oscillospiraceae bacterium]|jgi:uncharacterized alkaline shock family protein YloU|nr:Asp23/Gls24 family envelope stress response protein [Oscillospiraceae bacterium]
MGESKGFIRSSDERGSVNISEEVIAIISAVAAVDVEGVRGLFASPGKELTKIIGRKALSRGVKLCIEDDNVTIDVHVIAEMGLPVNEIGAQVQRAVISAVESTAGINVAAVNVHICGIALK